MDEVRHQFEKADIAIAGLKDEIQITSSRLQKITRQSTNQYLATRAIALGALGAFAAALAISLQGVAPQARLRFGRTMFSMAFGGIVALVVFALFTIRELSVFANHTAAPDETPDYWRVVILCLIAGAFADRLFAAARERVEDMTQNQNQPRG